MFDDLFNSSWLSDLLGSASSTLSEIPSSAMEGLGALFSSSSEMMPSALDYLNNYSDGSSFVDMTPYLGLDTGAVDLGGSVADFLGGVAAEPSFLDTIGGAASSLGGFLDKGGQLMDSKGGKFALGLGGGLMSYLDAQKRNKMMRQLMEQQAAALAARQARSAQYDAPVIFQNQRAVNTTPSASNPSFFTNNSLSSMRRMAGGGLARYVKGGSAGQDDQIPAMLSDGEYVFDADTVAAIGDGNNEAGAKRLDKMREQVRRHKRSASPKRIPPKTKRLTAYLEEVE